MTCINCGKPDKPGRPKKINDLAVRVMRERGLTLGQIAKAFKVTRGAVQKSIKRNAP